jgi:hypothetical protein
MLLAGLSSFLLQLVKDTAAPNAVPSNKMRAGENHVFFIGPDF